MSKTPFLTLEQAKNIIKDVPTPFHIYDEAAIAVDTHVSRVSKRLGLARKNDDVSLVEEKLMKKIPKDRWSKTHHQMVLFGRYNCKAMKPICEDCKLKGICKYNKK